MHARMLRPAVLLLAGLLPLGLAAACSSALQRYRLLSMFFDGVPDPRKPGTPDFVGPLPSFEPRPLSLEERARIQARRFKKVEVYFHKPFKERRCHECHRTRGNRPRRGPTWVQGLSELRLPKERLCSKCHTPPLRRYVHGPVGGGQCAECHEHHRSSFPHLLKIKDPSKLCVRCHVGDTFVTAKKHKTFSKKDCLACHDPHASDLRYMMRPEAVPGPGAQGEGPSMETHEGAPASRRSAERRSEGR